MVGWLFLRSFHRGERVYLAMLSRGYQGTVPETTAGKVGRGEWLFLLIVPAHLSVALDLCQRAILLFEGRKVEDLPMDGGVAEKSAAGSPIRI